MQYKVIECSRGMNIRYMPQVHRLRCKVFHERLNWTVITDRGMELDYYDIFGPKHLVVVDRFENVLACTRMLDTTGPYMLRDTFAQLLGPRGAPAGPRYVESSRFAVDTDRDGGRVSNGLSLVTVTLLAGVLEWGLQRGIEKIVAVVDTRMEKVLARAGWPLLRYADPQRIGSTLAIGGELAVSAAILAGMRQRFELPQDVFMDPSEQLIRMVDGFHDRAPDRRSLDRPHAPIAEPATIDARILPIAATEAMEHSIS